MNNNYQSTMVADERLAELAVEDDLYNYPPTQEELNSISAELQEYRKASKEPVAFTEKHEISNMHATGMYLRAWPVDRERNEVEGYTVALFAAPPLQAVTVPDEPLTQFKPVADLYEVTVPGGRSTTFTKDVAEAKDCIEMGWKVQEYVELERYQQACAGNSPEIPDGYALVPIEPTYQMSEAIGLPWEHPPFPIRWKRMLAAAPQPSSNPLQLDRTDAVEMLTSVLRNAPLAPSDNQGKPRK